MSDPLSLGISVAGVIVSICIGIWNRNHTNQKFQELHYPRPEIGLTYEKCKGDGGTSFCLRVKNTHPTSIMLGVEVIIRFPKRSRGWRLWGDKPLMYARARSPNISPEKPERILIDEQVGVESFLFFNFPGHSFERLSPTSTDGLRYRLVEEKPIVFEIEIAYTPSLLGSKRVSVNKKYHIVRLQGDADRYGMDWRAEEIG